MNEINRTFLCYDVASSQRALRNFTETKEDMEEPEAWQIWGIGLLMVTITSFDSSVGIFLMPYLERKAYHRTLTILGGLGVGCLTGTILFVMIPETFHLKALGSHDFAIKGCFIACGIYLLFLVDKILKFFTEFRKPEDSIGSIGKIVEQLAGERSIRRKTKSRYTEEPTEEGIAMQSLTVEESRQGKSGETTIVEKAEVEESSHMVLFGNLVINFIDGLTMGTAFSEGLIRGLSVSASIIITQFPQEIADFTILFDLGIGVTEALLLNLIPAGLSYLGFIFGVMMDEASHEFGDAVFAVSAGMYLFIVLSALIPEMNERVYKELKVDRKEGVIIAVLQIIAIIHGIMFIFGMSLLSGDITLDY